MENIDNYEKETICGSSLVLDEKKGKWVEASDRNNISELHIGEIDKYPGVEIQAMDSDPNKGNAITLPDTIKNSIDANTSRRPTTRAQAVTRRRQVNREYGDK